MDRREALRSALPDATNCHSLDDIDGRFADTAAEVIELAGWK
jgi:hypothetical protein